VGRKKIVYYQGGKTRDRGGEDSRVMKADAAIRLRGRPGVKDRQRFERNFLSKKWGSPKRYIEGGGHSS